MPLIQPNNVDAKSALLPYVPGPSTHSQEINFFQSTYPLEFNLITGATALTPAGTYYQFAVLGRNSHAIQVSGISTATVLVEATLDGQNWVTLESITANKISQYTGLYKFIRVSVSAYTSGTINVYGTTQRT